MCIDMGQADRSLYFTPRSEKETEEQWRRIRARNKARNAAAKEMGYDHWFDVPLDQDEEFIQLVNKLQAQYLAAAD